MSEQYNIISIDTLNNLNENINQNTSNIASAKTELNNNIDSVFARRVFTCKRLYNSSQKLNLYNICTINVGEMIFYALGTTSGSIKLTISNENMGVTYFAFGFSSAGVLKQTLIGGFSKASSGAVLEQSISDSNVSEIYVIAIRTAWYEK